MKTIHRLDVTLSPNIPDITTNILVPIAVRQKAAAAVKKACEDLVFRWDEVTNSVQVSHKADVRFAQDLKGF